MTAPSRMTKDAGGRGKVEVTTRMKVKFEGNPLGNENSSRNPS